MVTFVTSFVTHETYHLHQNYFNLPMKLNKIITEILKALI